MCGMQGGGDNVRLLWIVGEVQECMGMLACCWAIAERCCNECVRWSVRGQRFWWRHLQSVLERKKN